MLRDMLIDALITVFCFAVTVFSCGTLMTDPVNPFGWVILLLLTVTGATCTVAGVQAVVEYFKES